MRPRRVLWVAAFSVVIYIGFGYWVWTNFGDDIPSLSGAAWALVFLAAVAQISAKWFFGLLFRESVQEAGGDLRRWSAFKAALVGAGIARMIPAGGAVTPVGMSWTVRDETRGSTAGPALRTVFLNYGGLLILTGVGLLLARPTENALIGGLSVSLMILAPFVLVAGLAVMFGSGRLGTISKRLPKAIRRKVEDSMVNHLPGWESQIYIWARLLAEAAALWVVLYAFGIEVGALQVLAAFGLSQLVGGLPGTPGGLGVTEAGLVAVLAAYGFPAATTFVPTLVFRLVSYWLPAALGFLAGGSTFLHSDEAREAEAAA